MFGRRKKPPAVPTPPAEPDALQRQLAEDGALDLTRLDPAEPLLDTLTGRRAEGPRPVHVHVDGEYGWEVGHTTPEEHLEELLEAATAVMRHRDIEVPFGPVTVSDSELRAVIDDREVVLWRTSPVGRPVLQSCMNVLVALNDAAQRAGSERRWIFGAHDDRAGPALFLTPQQAAGLLARTDPFPDGTPALQDPREYLD